MVVAGMSHRTAPIPVRESFAVPRQRLHEVLKRLRAEAGLTECVILSTCNRVEIYGAGEGATAERCLAFLAGLADRGVEEIGPCSYRLAGEEAVRHAFRVAASLDSMVVGEAQILGQVKEAFEAAQEAGTLGPELSALRARCIAAARKARTETGISRNAVSVSHVAVEVARKIFGDLRGCGALLVGAGKMSELAARRLVAAGARATVLGGPNFEHAQGLAAALGGRAAPFEVLRDELARTDVVISGTSAPGHVIHRADVKAACANRHRPLFLIDLAVPRDVDPDVRGLPGVFLYDLDDLKRVAGTNLSGRMRQAERAEGLVEAEVQEFLAARKDLDVVPLLVDLRRRGEQIRRDELARAFGRMGPLTEAQVAAVEAATVAMVNKLLHAPTVQLKALARDGESATVGLLCKLLGLPPPSHVQDRPTSSARAAAAPQARLELRPSHS